jgi:hypothetical protein
MFVASEWTMLFLASILVFNFALYFGFVFVYDMVYFRENDYMGSVSREGMGTGQYWLMFSLIMMVCLGPMILGSRIMKAWKHGSKNFSLKTASAQDILDSVRTAIRKTRPVSDV